MTVPALAPTWLVRSLSAHDVPQLMHIQTVCYGDTFLESPDVFAQRLGCAYHCSLGLVRHGAPALQAYLAAYWSHPGKITPLDGFFTAPKAGPQLLYLHDVSVLPGCTGQGLARHLVQQAFAQARARGLQQAALVSVQGSQTYWERQGFSVSPVRDAQQVNHLQTYGKGALYMTAPL